MMAATKMGPGTPQKVRARGQALFSPSPCHRGAGTSAAPGPVSRPRCARPPRFPRCGAERNAGGDVTAGSALSELSGAKKEAELWLRPHSVCCVARELALAFSVTSGRSAFRQVRPCASRRGRPCAFHRGHPCRRPCRPCASGTFRASSRDCPSSSCAPSRCSR